MRGIWVWLKSLIYQQQKKKTEQKNIVCERQKIVKQFCAIEISPIGVVLHQNKAQKQSENNPVQTAKG